MPLTPAERPDHYGGRTVRSKPQLFAARQSRPTSIRVELRPNRALPVEFPDDDTLVQFYLTGVTTGIHATTEIDKNKISVVEGVVIIEMSIPASVLGTIDVWHCEADLLQTAGAESEEYGNVTFYIRVRSLQAREGSLDRLLTELRIRLRDYPAENELLRVVDFDDVELTHACVSALRMWNEEFEDSDCPSTLENFPYQANLLDGALSVLYEIAAEHYVRNRLPAGQVPAAGFDDKAKDNEYQRRADRHRKLWMEFIARTKPGLSYRWQ